MIQVTEKQMQTSSDTMTSEEKARVKEAFQYMEQNVSLLSESGRNFIHSLKKYYSKNKILSERQLKALFEIRNNLN